jgi:hypothetical protein
MTLTVPAWAADEARSLPYPLVVATVSGAHLYGFASVDSDLDLRAAHVLPAAEIVGLRLGPETVQHTGDRDGIELDVVSHDLRKFAKLLASPNGYVLEQLLSPLVVVTSPLHESLVAGELETDLNVLGTRLPYVPELIAAKREAEHGPLPPWARAALAHDVPALRAGLEAARDESPLPATASPEAVDALHDLIVKARLS